MSGRRASASGDGVGRAACAAGPERSLRPLSFPSGSRCSDFRESVIVGYSDMSEEEVEDLFEEMKGEFVGASYNVLARYATGHMRGWGSFAAGAARRDSFLLALVPGSLFSTCLMLWRS